MREINEYYTLELWEHKDDGSLGWRISSDCEFYDPLVVAIMAGAVVRQLKEEEEESELVVNVSMYENGASEAEFQGGRDFTSRENYVLTQQNLRMVVMARVLGEEFKKSSRFWLWLWNLEWLYLKITEKFKPYGGSDGGLGAVTAAVPEHLLRAFDGLPVRYLEGTGRVIPLRPKENSNA